MEAVDIDRAPHLANRIEAGLRLAVGIHTAVRAMCAIAVEQAIFDIEARLAEVLPCGVTRRQVGATNRLIDVGPNVATRKEGRTRPMRPHILQSSTLATVVTAMQELRRHKDMLTVMQTISTRLIGRIVVGIQALEVAPGVYHLALLDIEFGKAVVNRTIPTALVTVAPNIDRGIIHIAGDKLLHDTGSRLVIVAGLPARQLVEIQQTDRVAHLEEVTIRGVVTTHGVHIHRFDELRILQAHSRAQGARRLGMEAVAIRTLHDQARTIQINTVVGAEFDRAKTNLIRHAMSLLAQRKGRLVEVRRFGGPQLGIGIDPATLLGVVGHLFAIDRKRHGAIRRSLHLGIDLTRSAGIDRHMADMRLGHHLDIYGAIDTAKEPPIGSALRLIHTRIGRLLADQHLQPLHLVGADEGGYIVGKFGKATLMHRANLLAVDPHLGVGHRALEDEAVVATLGHLKGRAITTRLGTGFQPLSTVKAAIGIGTIALLFPAARHLDRAPGTAVLATRAIEVPGTRMLDIGTTQIDAFGRLSLHAPHADHRKDQK